jgi:AcrR family transcriptional regulator
LPSKRRISRELIVDTARRLFRAQGYHGTTLDQVAAELGVTRAALYFWVPSKQAVLCEIHEAVMDDLLASLENIASRDGDEVTRLEQALHNHVVAVANNLDAITVFFQDEASLPADRARRIAEKKRHYDHILERLVEQGQKKGDIRSDLTAKLVVNSLMGMCNWLYQWYNPDGPASADEVARHVVTIAIDGLTMRRTMIPSDGSVRARRPVGAKAR